MQQSRWRGQLRLRTAVFSIMFMSMLAVSVPAQTYQPARVRVAVRGLEDRQLLPTLRELAATAPGAFVTRVDLMIAAYALVNFIESGDDRMAGRLAAVQAAFGTYAEGDAAASKPTELASAAYFQKQFDLAWKERPEHAEVKQLREQTAALERRVKDLEQRLGQARAGGGRPAGDGEDGNRLVVVGGVAAALGMVFLATR